MLELLLNGGWTQRMIRGYTVNLHSQGLFFLFFFLFSFLFSEFNSYFFIKDLPERFQFRVSGSLMKEIVFLFLFCFSISICQETFESELINNFLSYFSSIYCFWRSFICILLLDIFSFIIFSCELVSGIHSNPEPTGGWQVPEFFCLQHCSKETKDREQRKEQWIHE